jgi:hypothetical protein
MIKRFEVIKYIILDVLPNSAYKEKYFNGTLNKSEIDEICNQVIPTARLEGKDWPEQACTMIGWKRLSNIQLCYQDIVKNNIKGDMIETGVWRGGATIFMAALIKYYNRSDKVFVADSFQGLPMPDDRYPADKGDIHHTHSILSVGQEEVISNFKKFNLLDDNVIFVKGFFETSLKNVLINDLCLLRLDGDMYSSTIQVLEQLYDKLLVGGYIIIDDYALGGCKKAVDDFRKTRNIKTAMQTIDWTGRYWKKE